MDGDLPLAELIRRALDEGRLPRVHPDKVWAGPGRDDHPCSACGARLLPGQIVYEFGEDGETYRFHLGCYGLWVGELIHRGRYRPP